MRRGRKFVLQGWDAYRRRCIPDSVTGKELEDLKQAYFAGAAILQETIMKALDPSPGATDGDLSVMADLQAELDEFGQLIDRRYLGTGRLS